MPMTRPRAALAAALLFLAAPAHAQGPAHHGGHAHAAPGATAGPIMVSDAWSRATPGAAKVGVGYLRVTNKGREPDRLVGGSVAVAGRFELHETSTGADNVARMRAVEGGLEIKPGETVELKPGGHHAMFLDLQRPLKEGETIAGTLQFERAGTVGVTYAVRGIGAGSAADPHRH